MHFHSRKASFGLIRSRLPIDPGNEYRGRVSSLAERRDNGFVSPLDFRFDQVPACPMGDDTRPLSCGHAALSRSLLA